MRFDLITIFPKIFNSYFNESMIKRAREKKLVDIYVHDLRKFSRDKHKKVDDRPYGGGPGMIFKIEPIIRAIELILKINPKSQFLPKSPAATGIPAKGPGINSKSKKTLIILFSAAGKQFNAKIAHDFAKKYDRIIMIAGHYEGIDERVRALLRQATSDKRQGIDFKEISIGRYVLTGGELPAMVVVDAVSRHIKGVLGKAESLEEKRHGIGLPVYTRPEIFEFRGKKYRAPKILLSGDHAKIKSWLSKHAKN